MNTKTAMNTQPEFKVGDRVFCRSHWGNVKGTITCIYSPYSFLTEEGEVIEVPEIASVLVDKTPKSWPYSTPEFAPETSKLKLI